MSREFEKQEDGRTSWWRIRLLGVRYQVEWGALPGSGQGMTMTCDSEADAEKRVARKIREKLAEGYVEVPSTAVEAAPAVPRPPRRSVLEAYRATAGTFRVTKVAGTTKSHHVHGGLGFESYLLVGPTDERGLLFHVKAASHDPDRVRTFLSFLEAHHAEVFAVENVWKVALPAPIGRMTHAVVLAPVVAQLHHKGLGYDQLWKASVIHDCEFRGDETVGMAEARVSGRRCLPTANWNRDPHPVVDLRTGKRAGKQKPKPFKVFVLGDLSRAVQQTKPTEVLEVRGVYGVAQVSRAETYRLTLPESEPRDLANPTDVVRCLESFLLGPSALAAVAPDASVATTASSSGSPAFTASTEVRPTEVWPTEVQPSKLAVVAAPPPDLSLEIRKAVAQKVQEAGGAYGEYVALAMHLLDPRTPDYFERAAEAQRLWRMHGATWLQDWGARDLRGLKLHGGMPDEIELGSKEIPSALGRVLAEYPVRRLAFRSTPLPQVKKVLAMPGREQVRHLTVEAAKPSGKGLGDALRRVPWPELRGLHMGTNFQSQGDETAELFRSMPTIEEVAWGTYSSLPHRDWPGLARLRRVATKSGRFHLRLELCEGAPLLEAIDAAVSVADPSMRMRSVRTLTSASSEILPCFPNLESVGLDVNEATAQAIADLPMFGALRELHADASTLEHLARHGVLARCQSLVELRTTAAPSLPDLVALLPSLRVLEVRAVYRSYLLDDHLALGILGKLRGPVTRLAFHGELGLDTVRGIAALSGLEEVCVASPSFDRACVEALLESPTLRRIEFGRSRPGFEQDVASLDSRGRYLGRPADAPGRSIWSHEP